MATTDIVEESISLLYSYSATAKGFVLGEPSSITTPFRFRAVDGP